LLKSDEMMLKQSIYMVLRSGMAGGGMDNGEKALKKG
jgi:hypothetical protein